MNNILITLNNVWKLHSNIYYFVFYFRSYIIVDFRNCSAKNGIKEKNTEPTITPLL